MNNMIKDWILKVQDIISEPLVAFAHKHELSNAQVVELSGICNDIESEIMKVSGYFEEVHDRAKEL